VSVSDGKWQQFKRFMHEELNVSKEDIRGWIKEACQEEAQKLVNSSFGKFDLKQTIYSMVNSRQFFGNPALIQDVKDALVRVLAERLEFEIKVKSDATAPQRE
jgi:5-bromo-4-chloroindolyl phosphate hydrolysis protein